MNQLLVTEEGDLLVKDEKHSAFLHVVATVLSYIFHPLFVIAWVVLYLLYRNNLVFIGVADDQKIIVFLRVFSTSIFLPLITVLLLKGLGFIQSIQLRTQKDRIIPYVACITFFFWTFYVSKTLGDPVELRAFLLCAFIAASASLIINNYMKVSMHAMSAGGLLAFFILLLFANKIDEVVSLLLAVLITGVICTSRFIASDHKPGEITMGFVVGVLLQLISWFIVH